MNRSVLLVVLGASVLLAIVTLIPIILFKTFNILLIAAPGIDKPIHYFEYLLIFIAMYFLSSFVLATHSRQAKMVLSFLIAVSISFIDESHQTFVPGRSVEYSDIIANILGIVTGVYLLQKKNVRAFYRYAVPGIVLGLMTLLTYHSYKISVHYNKGMMFEKRHDYAQAKAEYLLALQAGNDNPSVYNSIAWLDLEFLDGTPETAVEYAQEAYSKDPDNPDFLDTYGWALYRAGRPDEALRHLIRAFELDPDIFCIHHHLGAAYYAMGKNEDAIRHLEKQIARNAESRDGIKAKDLLDTIIKEMN